MTISPDRLAQLRAMPYEEYLQTPEWLATRKRILKRDKYQCQGCHAQNVFFHVHHYTYARLGCEEDTDLVTLCEQCHSELHRFMADPPNIPFLYKCGVGLGAATLGTIGIEGFLNAPLPAEIGVLIGAFMLAKNSPAIYGRLKQMLPEGVLSWMGQEPHEGKRSTLDIWLGRSPKTEATHIDDDDEQVSDEDVVAYLERNGINEETITSALQQRQTEPEGDGDEEEDAPSDFVSFSGGEDDDDGIELVAVGNSKRITVFSDLLKTGWRPSLEQIYVGSTRDGKHVFVPVEKLWHIALAGATGYGKSSLLRLVMAQLCSLKLSVVLLNPHYMIYDYNHKEDWTPYTPYLKKDPMVCKRTDAIYTMLNWMAYDLLEKRKERASRGESAGKPFFFILDEFPDIKAEVKDAPKLVGKLLRQGRKYGIYLVVASQDYSVKTIGIEGEGSLRKCFRTVFYVGGDPISVKELLNMPRGKTVPEHDLGQGTIMLRCATLEEPIVAHVPYLDNESLYLLLGPSTYVEPVKDVHTDELENSDVPSQRGDFRPDEKRDDARSDERNVPPLQQAQISPKNGECEVSEDGTFRRSDTDEVASEEGGRGHSGNGTMEFLPTGWTPEKVQMYPGFYRVFNHVDKALMAIDVSQSQINRAFARTILKQQGLWKEK